MKAPKNNSYHSYHNELYASQSHKFERSNCEQRDAL